MRLFEEYVEWANNVSFCSFAILFVFLYDSLNVCWIDSCCVDSSVILSDG
jgi:hypothetical protein